jgi:hypothetical protein
MSFASFFAIYFPKFFLFFTFKNIKTECFKKKKFEIKNVFFILFFMKASQGATDAQMTDVLLKGSLISLILLLLRTKDLTNNLRGSTYKESKVKKDYE